MTKLTAEDLRRIIRQCAGEDESVNLDDAFEITTFEDLGYDSLAFIETTSRIERSYGIKLREEETSELRTPGDLLTLVNSRLLDMA